MRRSRTSSLVRAALVAALVAAGALVAIPIGPVPVTLQVLVVAVAALVLSPAEAFGALGLYAIAGALGMPVFSGASAGPGVLLGPTGGFVLGFLAGAPAAARVRRALAKGAEGRASLVSDAAAMVTLIAVVYLAGWAQFALVTGREAAEAFALAVAPFIVVDATKAAAAVLVARAVRAAGLGDAPNRHAGVC